MKVGDLVPVCHASGTLSKAIGSGSAAPAAGPAQVLALGGADLAVWIADAVPDDGRVESLRA